MKEKTPVFSRTKIYLLIGILVAGVLFWLSYEPYDESIHDEYIERLLNHANITDFIEEDKENRYGYDISIYRSDRKTKLPYNVSSKKYYTYTVSIDITKDYMSFDNSGKFDILKNLTHYLENVKVGEGTRYEGYYNNITLNYFGLLDEPDEITGDSFISEYFTMNVFGYEKRLNGSTKEEWLIEESIRSILNE